MRGGLRVGTLGERLSPLQSMNVWPVRAGVATHQRRLPILFLSRKEYR
jgi:hypothetical protein